MKDNLLNFIVCPDCKMKLHLDSHEFGDMLLCENGHPYMIKNGVPCMLLEMDEKQRATADSFSHKWSSVPDYGYEENTREFHRKWYLERYKWESVDKLGEALYEASRILDAGAGVGRDVAWYAEHTLSPVIGMDIGESVHEAFSRLDYMPNVYIVQADITNMPFSPGEFDFIVSDFVLHHTPDTREALGRLVEVLRPGGMISFYVYAKKSETREACDDLLRAHTIKMSHEDCMKFSEAVMHFGKAVSEIDLDFQRMVYWDIMKCFWNPDFSIAHNISINYDWYKPVYAWRHDPEEVTDWCVDLGIKILHMDQQQSGISVRGVKK